MKPARSGSFRDMHSSSTSTSGWIFPHPSSSSAMPVFFLRRFTTRWRAARETAAPSAAVGRKLRFVVLSLLIYRCIFSFSLVVNLCFVSGLSFNKVCLCDLNGVIFWLMIFLWDGVAICQIQHPSQKKAQFEGKNSNSVLILPNS